MEREIVVHANKRAKAAKKKKNELTRNVMSGARGERDLCKNKNP